jgi:hypothetical protein
MDQDGRLFPGGPAQRTVSSKGGYAAAPGTGPDGETCGSCRHLYRKHMSKTYLKCFLMRRHWTGGSGTDIKAKSPACKVWEPVPMADTPPGPPNDSWVADMEAVTRKVRRP